MEELQIRTRLVWGQDALDALGELAGRRVLVVSDAFLAKNGLLEEVLAALKESKTAVFDQVSGEPTLQMVAKGVLELERAQAEAVVAFGGGSAMDCAKALGYCAGRRLPLWCIPTTAGTGSEVTSFAVLTDPGSDLKYPLVDNSLLPEVAILDGRFLVGVPMNVTADTGMDVLTHGAEACVAIKANTFTDTLAEKAFALAYANLPAACEGDQTARNAMLLASTLAGLAFNSAGLGACHAMAHALGGRLHAPHGRVNALLLPQVIEANGRDPGAARKYGQLAKLCGLSPNPRALAGGIRRLCHKLGMPEKLEGKADWRQVAADAMKDRCMADNPIAFTADEMEAMVRGVVK